MISKVDLKSQTVKELGQRARDLGIPGYASMRKDDLIKALSNKLRAVKAAKTRAKKKKTASRSTATKRRSTTRTRKQQRSIPEVKLKTNLVKLDMPEAEKQGLKDLSLGSNFGSSNGRSLHRDKITVLVRDSFWLQACWEIKRKSVVRAQAAMMEHWHTARPVVRLYEVEDASKTTNSARIVRDIEVHGGVTTWYINVSNPPGQYRVELGYLAANGEFHALCRSNIVTTPVPGSSESIDTHWDDIADNYERVYVQSGGKKGGARSSDLKELFEKRLNRPIGESVVSRFGFKAPGAEEDEFQFNVDSELIVFGSAEPTSSVLIKGEPVKLGPDGSFTVRMDLPDRRMVLPCVSTTADGRRQKTVVVAIERNTKVMEPVTREDEI
ncbi:MAG: DUF4912 domain-containing protein [Planctomycetaceae bacterium]|nr:DUF4912 domain-containing protein [Planctomycetaceae bacterium]